MDENGRWPDLFIVGAQRAGSTSIYDLLKRTEGVFMSQVKEPHYFSSISDKYLSPKPIRNKKKYLSLFRHARDNEIVGEASPTYLTDSKSSELIHRVIPNAKVVMILRDPVERAYSQYLLRVSSGKTYSFSEAIKEALETKEDAYKKRIIYDGLYYEGVKRFLGTFGTQNVKILLFEEFIKDPKKAIRDVLKFLRVKAEPPDYNVVPHNYLTVPRNKLSENLLNNELVRKIGKKILSQDKADYIVKGILGKKSVKPEMNLNDREFLSNFYREDVKKLEVLLGKKPPWKNFKK